MCEAANAERRSQDPEALRLIVQAIGLLNGLRPEDYPVKNVAAKHLDDAHYHLREALVSVGCLSKMR
ncbi:MAG: hypothetical protein HPY55_07250 [Firmicutes bacterium]|nr:hypothetical protein [Bacillota bacterium]